MLEALVTIPRWSTIGLFVAIVVQFVFWWVQAKKTGKSFRSAVLPNALLAGAVSTAFAREFFAELPIWIDATLAILALLATLIAVGLWLVQLRRYVKDAWRLEEKKER